ncbi:hypothetical protein PybrP1_005929, partial [[Pythium] brassicae (nom. inval.)]
TGQPTMGMAGANSAPGPSEPPTTSPMPTFTSRPTAESAYPAQQGAPAQGGNGTPNNGAPNGGPGGPGNPGVPGGPGGPGGGPGGPPQMPHGVRGNKPAGDGAMGMIRSMPPNVGMNPGMMPPRGAIGGGMPGMQHSHPQASPQVQAHHSQAQAAHHAQIAQAHHHAQMQAHQAAQAAQAAQGDRRGMPGPPPPQRLGSLNTKNLGPPPGSNGPPQGRRDRFPMPMSDQKHPHPSLPMPPGRR